MSPVSMAAARYQFDEAFMIAPMKWMLNVIEILIEGQFRKCALEIPLDLLLPRTPVKVVSKEFRDMFLSGLEQAYCAQKLSLYGECPSLTDVNVFSAFLEELKKGWVVYAKPPFGGPEHVLQYLARYTHRVAISNHRIVSMNDSSVTFQWKDYAHNNQQCTTSLTHEDFLRRFLQHILPKGLPRIRYFGWLANRRRGHRLPLCRILLQQNPNPPVIPDNPYVPHCPRCHGEMRIIERLTATQLWQALQRMTYVLDTS